MPARRGLMPDGGPVPAVDTAGVVLDTSRYGVPVPTPPAPLRPASFDSLPYVPGCRRQTDLRPHALSAKSLSAEDPDDVEDAGSGAGEIYRV